MQATAVTSQFTCRSMVFLFSKICAFLGQCLHYSITLAITRQGSKNRHFSYYYY